MKQTVIGIFESAADANQAAQQLIEKGFKQENVDVSVSNTYNKDTYREDKDDDSIGGFFRSLFGDSDEEEKNKHIEAARRGTLVTVHTKSEEEAERASDILDEYGAIDVNDQSYDAGMGTETGVNTVENNDLTDATVPVINEDLEVGKRTVETGRVRIRSRIIEKPVEEHLRLRTERVKVERHHVDRPVTEADMDNFKEGSIEFTEHAEIPVVNKKAKVVEEVSLHKEVEEHDEVVQDTVRRTEVDVDQKKADRKNIAENEPDMDLEVDSEDKV